MVKKAIVNLVRLYYQIRYIVTGKTRKDAWVDYVESKGGKFVKMNKKRMKSGRYKKAPKIY